MSESSNTHDTDIVEAMIVPDVKFHAPAVAGRTVSPTGSMAIATTRAAQEVQAAIVMAKAAPRDQDVAFARIIASCKRRTLAEKAEYSYKRGSGQVTGPSIRLAEEVARNWGNIDWGFVELDQSNGESTVMAYAWDLETNTRSTRVFKVRHIRQTKTETKVLTDARDIYELVANQAARRIRASLLALIPGDVIEAAIAQCNKTLMTGHTKSIRDRVRECIAMFDGIGVSKAQIEAHVQHGADSIDERELLALGKVFNAIKDGYTTVREAFPPVGGGGAAAEAKPAKTKARERLGIADTPPADDLGIMEDGE